MFKIKQTDISEEEQWDLLIKPKRNWFDLRLHEVWEHRDLVMLFVKRDFVSKYKQTILGPLWFVIGPLLSSIVYSLIFGSVAKIPTEGTPSMLFYLSGIISWNYFAGCLNTTSNTFLGNSGIFGKVYFPRLITPISGLISNLIQFAIQFGLFLVILAFYALKGFSVNFSLAVVLIPVDLIILAFLALGFGIIISSLTVKYRDLSNFMIFGMQLWMYATPIIYPISAIPGRFRGILQINPVAPVIESFKQGLLGISAPKNFYYLYSIAFTVCIVIAGVLLFNRVENKFMDSI